MHDANRQLRFTRQHELLWAEVEPPSITERSSAVVRPLIVARSDADVSVLCPGSASHQSVFRIPDPVAAVKSRFENLSQKIPLPRRHVSAGVGQQGIGEVVHVGPDVTSIKPGQLVVLPAYGTGNPDAAPVGDLRIFDKASGWLSDLVLVADASSNLQVLPAELDPLQSVAAGGDLLSAWNAVEPLLKPLAKPVVLIMGGTARCAALYSVALASSFGCARLDYVDDSAERVAIAKKLGAESTEVDFRQRKAADPPSYNLVICGSSERHAASLALQQLLPDGVFVQLPPYKLEGVRVPLSLLYTKRLSVAMSAEPSNARLQGLLAYLAKHSIDLSAIHTHRADFHEAAQHLSKDTTGVVLYRTAMHSSRPVG